MGRCGVAALRGALLLSLLAIACGRAKEPEPRAGSTFPVSARIGWLHGPCLAIRNADLARGTPIDVVILAEPQRLEPARIAERAGSSQNCPALLPERAKSNARPGVFFYTVEATGVDSSAMGIGIVEPPAHPKIVDGMAQVDLDGDGRAEVFSSCATAEGVKFAVWTERAYRGEPLWSADYHLDYESTPTCP